VPDTTLTSPASTPNERTDTLRLSGLRRQLRRITARTAIVAGLLTVIVGGGGALRWHVADGRPGAASPDQHAYVQLARDIRAHHSYGDSGMKQPFHWAPGAPVLFAAADVLSGHPASGKIDQRAARRAEAIVGTGTLLAVFALAALIAGAWAGLAAAAVAALYPPLIHATAFLLTEPFGAFAITAALAVMVWAWRRRAPWAFVLAGVSLGLACLVRADVALAAIVLPLAAGGLLARRYGWRCGAERACAMLLGSAAMIVPWSAYASTTAGHFIPITDGGAGTLFVATYLPGHGTIFGLKHALVNDVHRAYPYTRKMPTFRIPEGLYLDAVAHRHPNVSREGALRKEVLHNLRVYALGSPLDFASMMISKFWRMWTQYYRGTHRGSVNSTLWAHRAIVALALLGALLGLGLRRRSTLGLVLLAILVTTALDVFFVAEPRHAFRLLPSLIAAGVGGWALLLSGRLSGRRARAPAPARPSPPEARSAA
jgi:MFS family permease